MRVHWTSTVFVVALLAGVCGAQEPIMLHVQTVEVDDGRTAAVQVRASADGQIELMEITTDRNDDIKLGDITIDGEPVFFDDESAIDGIVRDVLADINCNSTFSGLQCGGPGCAVGGCRSGTILGGAPMQTECARNCNAGESACCACIARDPRQTRNWLGLPVNYSWSGAACVCCPDRQTKPR